MIVALAWSADSVVLAFGARRAMLHWSAPGSLLPPLMVCSYMILPSPANAMRALTGSRVNA